jgi:hypothetical protein
VVYFQILAFTVYLGVTVEALRRYGGGVDGVLYRQGFVDGVLFVQSYLLTRTSTRCLKAIQATSALTQAMRGVAVPTYRTIPSSEPISMLS